MMRLADLLVATGVALAASPACAQGMPEPLTVVAGDVVKGRALITNRQAGLCVLCHSGPWPDIRFQGDLAPNLTSVGGRLSVGEIRQRLVDGRAINPMSIMPSYLRTEGLSRVASDRKNKPLASPQEIEDMVAYLASLK